jgi:hypothetical protein
MRKKYYLSGVITVSCWTEVFAESEEEAEKIALERSVEPESFHSDSYPVNEFWHVGADGEPYSIGID